MYPLCIDHGQLFVSGFPAEAGELEIVQLFDPFGKVVTIKIVLDKVTRKRKGYAFLEMEHEEAAQTDIRELNGAAWGDRELTVNYATEKTAPARSIKTGYQAKPTFPLLPKRSGPAFPAKAFISKRCKPALWQRSPWPERSAITGHWKSSRF